ncbi:hypothetical protein OTU49_000159 [Cherax quadricarinatus]|uniref:Uncharacterized protein n=1 Tax=Cherax quadricarinatus TaxID=27406 RepID=A0AAW0XZV1_CHEQU
MKLVSMLLLVVCVGTLALLVAATPVPRADPRPWAHPEPRANPEPRSHPEPRINSGYRGRRVNYRSYYRPYYRRRSYRPYRRYGYLG